MTKNIWNIYKTEKQPAEYPLKINTKETASDIDFEVILNTRIYGNDKVLRKNIILK